MLRVSIIFLLTVLLVIGVVAGTYWLMPQEGGISFDLFGFEGSLPFLWSILALLLVGAGLAVLWALLFKTFSLPWSIGRARRRSQETKATKALADGLLAAEAGDVKAAKIYAKRSAKYAKDERLKLFLEARIAEAEQDWIAAERVWGVLTRLPGGELAGLRGASYAALERGDKGSAEANARRALEIKSGASWPFAALFDLQVSRHEWANALATLQIGEKRKLVSGDSLRRRRAVLQTARAVSLGPKEKEQAQKLLAAALKTTPGFPPAVWHGAKLLINDDRLKAAFGVIELGWKAEPHPALARLARQITSIDSKALAAKRLTALANTNLNHRESRILLSEIAAEQGNWSDAIRGLAVLVEEEPTARLCLLMERALKGYGDEAEAARWARIAVTAAREADWSDLDPKGGAFSYSGPDWARLVYKFGDAGQLVHPRYEGFARELDVTKPAPALPHHGRAVTAAEAPAQLNISAPLDYAPPASKASD